MSDQVKDTAAMRREVLSLVDLAEVQLERGRRIVDEIGSSDAPPTFKDQVSPLLPMFDIIEESARAMLFAPEGDARWYTAEVIADYRSRLEQMSAVLDKFETALKNPEARRAMEARKPPLKN